MRKICKFLLISLLMLTFSSATAFAQSISAYYVTNFKSVKSVKALLRKNGFRVLSVYNISSTKSVITITNSQLRRTNTFMGAINILVNSKKEIRVQNPEYLAFAYLGKKYHKGGMNKTIVALSKALGKLKPTNDVLDSSKLTHYHFMFGMPYFEDTITVAKGNGLSPKGALYKLKLPNGNILIGHRLSSAKGFLNKINSSKNSALLPYQSMIKGNQAIILAPKYYLALSLPLLKMGNFMKISDIPQKIENDILLSYK